MKMREEVRPSSPILACIYAAMVLTRGREAAVHGLFQGIALDDALTVEWACQQLHALPELGGITPVHWAAAYDAASTLPAVAAVAGRRGGSSSLDAPLPRLDGTAWPPWLQGQWLGLRHSQREALMVPGCTPLAVAAR